MNNLLHKMLVFLNLKKDTKVLSLDGLRYVSGFEIHKQKKLRALFKLKGQELPDLKKSEYKEIAKMTVEYLNKLSRVDMSVTFLKDPKTEEDVIYRLGTLDIDIEMYLKWKARRA